jgi:hypothetical protein
MENIQTALNVEKGVENLKRAMENSEKGIHHESLGTRNP